MKELNLKKIIKILLILFIIIIVVFTLKYYISD